MSELEGQVVLVTGASGGLGPHITKAFADAGALVVASARRTGDSGSAVPADLTRPDEARKLADSVAGRFGRIDILAHITGGFAGGSPVHEIDDATWNNMMALNAGTAFHIMRAVIPHMRRAGRGRIIAIGSRAAVEPAPDIAAYSASKAALVSLVKTIALENRDAGITANTILPGTIDTEANRKADPQADRSKWVSPERLAALAVFLASDGGAHITGAAIPVYGAGL